MREFNYNVNSVFKFIISIVIISGVFFSGAESSGAEQNAKPLQEDQEIRGWNILSSDIDGGIRTINKAAEYGINHLQISHHNIMDLRHVRNKERLSVSKKFVEHAHKKGIQEVAFWDHCLYPLEYYPDKFKTGPNGTLNLDNPEFWEWLKDDYREMLETAPAIEAIILTFIETGARVEEQHSENLTTDAEKLAKVVNTISEVIIDEYNMNLYTRTFAYDKEEYQRIKDAIKLFEYDDIRLMIKETPHDFLFTHPPNPLPGKIDRKTLIEFDATGEFHGQGIVLNTFPELFIKRWSEFLKRDHIGGYVARMDRYGDTHIVNRPSEIHAKAIDMYYKDRSTTLMEIYKEFITNRYGKRAYPMLREAFQNSKDITLSTFYTLNTNTANHSRLNYDPYRSSYARHVSGRWLEPPVTYVPRTVNKEFHYWKEIINTIAPDWAKKGGAQLEESPEVVNKGWLNEKEMMNDKYLKYIIREKEYGIKLAKENLQHLEAAKPYLDEKDYKELYHQFHHTLLTIKLHREVAAAYWGFRIYSRGEDYRSDYVVSILDQALNNMLEIAEKIEEYPVMPPQGQWDWVEDAKMAKKYYRWITEEGWPEETEGYKVSFGGKTYP